MITLGRCYIVKALSKTLPQVLLLATVYLENFFYYFAQLLLCNRHVLFSGGMDWCSAHQCERMSMRLSRGRQYCKRTNREFIDECMRYTGTSLLIDNECRQCTRTGVCDAPENECRRALKRVYAIHETSVGDTQERV